MTWADPACGRYRTGALLFLGLTVASGAWLRWALLRPSVLGPFDLGHAIHAHSHAAFFGWIAMAVFGLVATDLERRTGLGVHAGLVAGLSALAFLTFLRGGYDPASMIVAGLHVLLWLTFVGHVLTRSRGAAAGPPYFGASLAFLVVAGAGTVAPALAMVRGVTSAWWSEAAVGVFLVPFLAGFALLAAMGAVYRTLPGTSSPVGALALGLVSAGVMPSVLAYPGAPPPVPWVGLVGRLGVGLVGVGLVTFGGHVLLRASDRSFRSVAAGSAVVAGVLQVVLAAGVGSEVAHRRPITIAFLHLVLLGLVSPALLHALGVTGRDTPRRLALYATGLVVMLGSLVVSGVGPLTAAARAVGVDHVALLRLALLGGVGVALAVLGLLPGALGVTARVRRKPPSPRGAPQAAERGP